MLDRQIIQNRGFANTVTGASIDGFQVVIRNPNYRGLAGSLIDGVAVTVDGHSWSHEQTTLILREREFTLDSLRRSTDVRWALDETMAVRVPLSGGLRAGVHHVAVDVRLRAPYMPAEIEPNIFHVERDCTIVPTRSTPSLQYGVSLYSYTGDLYTTLTLEDAMAEIADMGATGIEILGEGHVPGYPHPSTEWIDTWKSLLERYSLTPTNYGSWIDSRMWLHRDLTAQEGHEQLAHDVRLAAELGFSYIRPKIGVVSLDLTPHPIWEEAVERTLDLAAEKNIVICPEIHSPTPIRHPVVDDYLAFIERTGTKNFGLLIDTGIFMTTSAFQGLDGAEPESEEDIPVPLRALGVPPTDLLDIMDHVVFLQAKFYEIDENLADPHIPWPEIFEVLRRYGYSGFLSSEYEGRREPGRGAELLRRQHAMFRILDSDH